MRSEITQALGRNIPVLPVTVDGAVMPAARQLPEALWRITHIQAIPLRARKFDEDAAAIAQRLKVMLAERRPSGLPVWAFGVGVAAALLAGVAAGPLVLANLDLSHFGVTLPSDSKLRSDLSEARRQVEDIKAELSEAEKERDKLRTAQRKQGEAVPSAPNVPINTLGRESGSTWREWLDAFDQSYPLKSIGAAFAIAVTLVLGWFLNPFRKREKPEKQKVGKERKQKR